MIKLNQNSFDKILITHLKVRSIDRETKIARVERFVICFVDEIVNLSRELDILSIGESISKNKKWPTRGGFLNRGYIFGKSYR